YDPFTANTIYVFPDSAHADYWECTLTDRSREYRDQSMWELWDSRRKQRKATASAQLQERESKRGLDNRIQTTIENAEKLRPPSFGDSTTRTLADIGKNR